MQISKANVLNYNKNLRIYFNLLNLKNFEKLLKQQKKFEKLCNMLQNILTKLLQIFKVH